MKKIAHLIVICTIAVCFSACNNNQEKNAASPAETEEANKLKTDSLNKTAELHVNCAGIANLLISEDSSKLMMARYDSIYKKIKTQNPLVYLRNSEWIDAMIIKSYANFFENSGKAYDGVRFVNAATSINKVTRLLLVPTKPSTSSYHTDVWGNGVIPLADGSSTEYQDWETKPSVAITLKNNFYTLYRNSRNLPKDKDPLSESVWMSRCVFIYLRDLIEKPENQIDGIRVYMGAYGRIMGTVPGQIAPYQSTILLVPTTLDSVSKVHNDRWDLLRPDKSAKMIDALNHGELCPNACGDN